MRLTVLSLAMTLFALQPVASAAERASVTRVAPGKYRVSRAYLDRTLKDPQPVLRQARAVPYLEKGAMIGYRLLQIEPGSLYTELGLRNEDVVLSINGTALDSALKAIGALTLLKGASRVSLKLKRKGRVLDRIYDVQ